MFFFLDVMADDLDVNAATCRCSPTDRKTNKDQKLNEAKSDFCRSVVGTDSFSLSLSWNDVLPNVIILLPTGCHPNVISRKDGL